MADAEDFSDDLIASFVAAVAEGLQDAGDVILNESNLDSPTLTGEMDGTARVEVQGLEMAVGYESEYALKQHEKIAFKHPQGDKPKYLENALTNKADAALEALGGPLRKVLGG